MSGLRIGVAGDFTKAKALRNGSALTVKAEKAYTQLTLSRLSNYEIIVLE